MKLRFGLALALCATLAVTGASAADDPAGAQALFDRGLEAFEAGRVDEACDLFKESMRLDPANGTLLNLARCHERQGRTATAWAEYTDVATLSARAGETARADVATEAAERLAPHLVKLQITVDNRVPGLVVTRDGVVLSPASWGQALPIDPGHHRVEASAPGHGTFVAEIDVPPGGSGATITIPRLEPLPRPAPVTSSPSTPPYEPGPVLVAGIVIGSVGVTATIVGAVLGGISLHALSTAREDPALCPDNVCTPRGREWVDSAEVKGNASTGLFVVGGALAATGLVMIGIELGADGQKETAKVGPIIGPGAAGANLIVPF